MTVPEALQLALQHHQAGRFAEADTLYRQILAVAPQNADALHLIGAILHQRGEHEAALPWMHQALAINPNVAFFHSNLGEAYRKLGRLEEAVTEFVTAIRLQPAYPEAFNNLGTALLEQGHPAESVEACRRALELKPDCAPAYYNLGNALRSLNRLEAAVAAFQASLQLAPNAAETLNNLGNALKELGRMDEAVRAYRRTIELQPEDPEAQNNLGNALKEEGLLDEAIAAYERALELWLADPTIHSNLLLSLTNRSGTGERRRQERQRWAETIEQPLARLAPPHGNDRSPDRRLRIGYVSPDFREHSVAYFMESLLAAHDPAQVELFTYADGVLEDPVTARLRALVGTWRRIHRLKDTEVAALVRQDGIDILVDLAGHTAGNRLPAFARKPAPVQVGYLGYCDFTGLHTIDYRLSDALADPPDVEAPTAGERLVRLPQCAWCFKPTTDAPPVAPAPAARAGHITFGCFNARPKISDEMLALWARLLLAAPGARLLLKSLGFGEAAAQTRARAVITAAGVAPDRVEFQGRTNTTAEHLALYARVDIALDCFPYHGTTTTCEALWMGVPVVTLAGHEHASRVGVSLLTNLGRPEWIAQTPDEYVAIAARLAADPAQLAHWRGTLRAEMQASPLMDGPRIARSIESAYREMWRTWCAQQLPSPPP